MKAIFLDRDDTIIKDHGYMFKIEDIEFFEKTIETLQTLFHRGYKLFIVTNQSGIGRGYFSVAQMHCFNQELIRILKLEGVEIVETVYCPHSPEESCDCRKPSPKLINELCLKYNIEKKLSYMVGDKLSDKEAGLNAGVNAIQIRPGEIHKLIELIA